MKTAVAAVVAIVLFCGSSTYAGGCANGRCGVSVLAPGVSVQVSPPVFVPQIVLPQTFQLQVQPPQVQLQAAPLVVPQLGIGAIRFDPDERVILRRRNGAIRADIQGDVRRIKTGLFGRVKRIEFFD